jgi:lipopolysaccharide export system permease protein
MELPVAWADWMTNFATRIGDSWNALKMRLSRRNISGQGVS